MNGKTTDKKGQGARAGRAVTTAQQARSSAQLAATRTQNKSIAPVQACQLKHPDVCTFQSVESVVAYIHGEMTRNASGSQVKRLKELDSWGIDWSHPVPGMRKMERYVLWYELVKTGGPWDHKPKILQRFGEWTCDKPAETNYRFDIWSNIHYGYVGLAAGFSEWDLLSGAGVAQLKQGLKNVPDGYLKRRFERLGDADVFSALDDPADQAAIKLGFDLWKKHGANVSAGDILQAVRAASSGLATRGCPF